MNPVKSVWTRFLRHGAITPRLAILAFALILSGGSVVEARGTAPGAINSARELRCLALNIYFEARSEPKAGKFAVGHVVMNRVAHRRFPKSICNVIRQGGYKRRHRCQFSWWCDGRSDKPRDVSAWDESRRIAAAIYTGTSDDPTDGALWYHADYVKPNWRSDFQRGPKIGRHVFYAIETMKTPAPETTRSAIQYVAPQTFAMVPASYEISNVEPGNKFEVGGNALTEMMLMIFGIGLIGLGLTGYRLKFS